MFSSLEVKVLYLTVRARTVYERRKGHSKYADAECELRQRVGELEIELNDWNDWEEQVDGKGTEQRQCCQDKVKLPGRHFNVQKKDGSACKLWQTYQPHC